MDSTAQASSQKTHELDRGRHRKTRNPSCTKIEETYLQPIENLIPTMLSNAGGSYNTITHTCIKILAIRENLGN